MFKCENCGRTSEVGEKQTVKVLKTRPKEYRHKVLNVKGKPIKNKKTGQFLEKVSNGEEIVKEIIICGRCV